MKLYQNKIRKHLSSCSRIRIMRFPEVCGKCLLLKSTYRKFFITGMVGRRENWGSLFNLRPDGEGGGGY